VSWSSRLSLDVRLLPAETRASQDRHVRPPAAGLTGTADEAPGDGAQAGAHWALRTLARIIERAAAEAGSQAVVCDGQVLTLAEGAYSAIPAVMEGTRLDAVIDADKPFTVSFDPADLLNF
jgi:hypothetical protein